MYHLEETAILYFLAKFRKFQNWNSALVIFLRILSRKNVGFYNSCCPIVPNSCVVVVVVVYSKY